MMDWFLLSALGTAALLLIEIRDFIRDNWSHWPAVRLKSSPIAQSACAAGAPQTMPLVATIRAVTHGHCGAAAKVEGIDKGGWQTTARRLAGQWTVLDGVVFQHDAHVHDASATTEIAMRRALSPDQILSARIDAAYAVWAAARSSRRLADAHPASLR